MVNQSIGVFGATSLVGKRLLPLLIQNGWEVTAFSRQKIDSEFIPTTSAIKWCSLESLRENQLNFNLDQKIPYWFYLAPIWTLPAYFDFLSKQMVKKIIVLSSTSIFTKVTSSDTSEIKIAKKLEEGEANLRNWAERHEINWIILRPTLIYGYGQDRNVCEIARFIQRFHFFPLLGNANGLRQPIHADDVAAACYAAFLSQQVTNRVYNISGNELIAYRDMVERIFVALDKSPILLKIPYWFFQLAIKLLKPFPRYSKWSIAMVERMGRDLVFDHLEASRDFGFMPRAFKLGKEDIPL